MEKKITNLEGFEVGKIEIVDGMIVVTFKERNLPKSWEEFCEMFPIKSNEYFIDILSEFKNSIIGYERIIEKDMNLRPNRATAEAVLALCQLIQLRDCYNGDWVPDWNGDDTKFMIEFTGGEINVCSKIISSSSPLYFKTRDLRDEFLRNFRPLIETLKPIYGIMEGGEE